MKIQDFLLHHGIAANPFAEEDAQTDPVFREHCIASTYHPTWDKVFGDPAQPATSIVFGEKGAGKTAMRLQIVRHLADYNRAHPDSRLYVIQYDDFNPFLDRFADRFSQRKRQSGRALSEWKLWDHMDSILSLGVTGLVDQIFGGATSSPPGNGVAANELDAIQARKLDRHQARDLLILAACYDQSTAETTRGRWRRLRKALRFHIWRSWWDRALGIAGTAAVLGVIAYSGNWSWLATIWPYLVVLAAWIPWLVRVWKWHWAARAIVRNVRVGNREIRPLRQVLMSFLPGQINGQPLPNKERTDDRYELLAKFQGILRTLGFSGIIVLVDRVDEPHLINGSVDLMRALLWPMLDNKFLKQSGVGLKLLLPIELTNYIDREDREFYQRARLDKQNMIRSLEWTGEALYDVANARLAACAVPGKQPATLSDLFEESVGQQRLIQAVRGLRVPRHLFKFMYRLLVAHCNAYTEEQPAWRISSPMFEATLAVYSQEQDAVDRGVRAG